MRNLGEYPVTDAEIVAGLRALRMALVEQAGGRVGDIRPYLLDAAIERIDQHPRAPQKIGVNGPFAIHGPKGGRGLWARLFGRGRT